MKGIGFWYLGSYVINKDDNLIKTESNKEVCTYMAHCLVVFLKRQNKLYLLFFHKKANNFSDRTRGETEFVVIQLIEARVFHNRGFEIILPWWNWVGLVLEPFSYVFIFNNFPLWAFIRAIWWLVTIFFFLKKTIVFKTKTDTHHQ